MFKISRRKFFGLFRGLAPALVVGPPDPVAAGPQAPAYRNVYLDEVAIAGFRYYAGMRPEVAVALRIGETLVLRRQPENPHDDKAIEVVTETGMKLGYLPRTANLTPAILADQSVPLGAEISVLNLDAQPWQRVRVRVYQLIADVPPPSRESVVSASDSEPSFGATTLADPVSTLRAGLNAAAAERYAWFGRYFQDVAAGRRPAPPQGKRDICPCCGYPSALPLCLLCQWENDGVADADDPDHSCYGANVGRSLTEARVDFYERLTGLKDAHSLDERIAAFRMASAIRAIAMAYDSMPKTTDDFWLRASWYEVYQQEESVRTHNRILPASLKRFLRLRFDFPVTPILLCLLALQTV